MFTAYIRTDEGSYQHRYHLGTDEDVARGIVKSLYHHSRPALGTKILSVVLLKNSLAVDSYDGEWGQVRIQTSLAWVELQHLRACGLVTVH